MGRWDELDVRRLCPKKLEKSITTPHEHETEHHVPLWLIWVAVDERNGGLGMPALDSVCDTADMCRAHCGMVVESKRTDFEAGLVRINVERIPANHRFASSLPEWQHRALQSVRRFR